MNALKIVTYASFALCIGALLYILFFSQSAQLNNRNARRARDLELFAAQIEETFHANGRVLPVSIAVLPRQLGTAADNCQLVTKHCEVTVAACISPEQIAATPSGFLSADIVSGTQERTHYSVQALSPTVIKLTACSDEIENEISITKDLITP